MLVTFLSKKVAVESLVLKQCLQGEFHLYFIAYRNFEENSCFISCYDKPVNRKFPSGLFRKTVEPVSEKMVALCWNKGILKLNPHGVSHFHINYFVSLIVISRSSYHSCSIKAGITLSD